MSAIRRAILALTVGAMVATVLRVKGTGGVPPRHGSWRQLSGPELR